MSILTALGSKEAEMRIIGCDLHASQQSIAMRDQETGETAEATLKHEGNSVRDFYAALPRPVVVGIEATGAMGWCVELMEELGLRATSAILREFAPPTRRCIAKNRQLALGG